MEKIYCTMFIQDVKFNDQEDFFPVAVQQPEWKSGIEQWDGQPHQLVG